ncbi:hypothetical protein HCB46_08555 [Listeria ivanovii]|uniref:hypothetical protein n=1 Tax=Listeria ivanovii TaxID=1638 RepID=UPI001627D228|nr:hypothetical protein [Listeria ivanovii]MBC2255518.1 hypothetical protein [Listeria ivanovii]
MNRKKITIISIIAVLLLSIGGYMVYQKMKPKPFSEVVVEAKTPSFDNGDELKNASDAIVLGQLDKRGDSQIEREATGGVIGVYRMSDFKVSEVIKDETNQNLEEGSIIPIYENEGYDKETNTTYHIAGYEKMENDETYMLFLSYDPEDAYYVPVGVNFGKINIDSDKETELYGQDNIEIEKEINEVQSEALEEYDDEIKEAENQ